MNKKLNVKTGFLEFENLTKLRSNAKNLFVISQFGQLKQMQSLIKQYELSQNLLVVLYTYKTVQLANKIQEYVDVSLFSEIVLLKIPHSFEKPDLKKNIRMNKVYKEILSFSKFKAVYVGDFYGHYNILLSRAKQKKLQVVLVEEGLIIDKLKGKDIYYGDNTPRLTFKEVKRIFKHSGYKFFDFVQMIWETPAFRSQSVRWYSKLFPIATSNPFTNFDIVYSYYPKLLEKLFQTAEIKSYKAYYECCDNEVKMAKNVVERYQMRDRDILFISQEHYLEPRLYMKEMERIFNRCGRDSKVFVKPHSKENRDSMRMYQIMSEMSGGRVVILDCDKLSVESLIFASPIGTVLGLTVNTLIYASLIREQVKSISVVKFLNKRLSWSAECSMGLEILSQSIDILEQFDYITFLDEELIGENYAK